jgi:hypothetical protein
MSPRDGLLGGLALALLLAPTADAGGAAGLDRVRVLALAPGGGAVVAGADGALRVVRAGDALPSIAGDVVVVEVLADRLVVESVGGGGEAGEEAAAGAEPVRAWIFPARRPGGASKVQILHRRPPVEPWPGVRAAGEAFDPESVPAGARARRPPGPVEAEGGPTAAESTPTERGEGTAAAAGNERGDDPPPAAPGGGR